MAELQWHIGGSMKFRATVHDALARRLERNCGSVHRCRIKPRGNAVGAGEQPGHVALICETSFAGGIGQGHSGGDLFSRLLEPALYEIGMRREAGELGETPDELELADAAEACQFGNRQRRGRVVVDARTGRSMPLGAARARSS